MDQVECPSCHRFYSSNEEHRCPVEGKNSESPLSTEEEIEKTSFHKSTSDVPNDSFSECHQTTSKRKLEHFSLQQSSSKIVKKENESSDTSAENVPLTSSSHTPSDTSQCSLSGFASDCLEGTEFREEKEGVDIHGIAQKPSPFINVGQDHSVSYDTSTGAGTNTSGPSSYSAAVCYVCTVCDRQYPNLSKLRSHVAFHTGEKKFLCDHCGRGFTDKKNFDIHVQCYVGQVPTICKGCNSSFIMRCGFDSHYCSVYGRKIFTCDFCPRRFAYEGSLNAHKRCYH